MKHSFYLSASKTGLEREWVWVWNKASYFFPHKWNIASCKKENKEQATCPYVLTPCQWEEKSWATFPRPKWRGQENKRAEAEQESQKAHSWRNRIVGDLHPDSWIKQMTSGTVLRPVQVPVTFILKGPYVKSSVLYTLIFDCESILFWINLNLCSGMMSSQLSWRLRYSD